jgi:hypothetical protein
VVQTPRQTWSIGSICLMLFAKLDNGIYTIRLNCFDSKLMATPLALIVYSIFLVLYTYSHRFHRTATTSRPISRIYVNVFAPKTFGAMVGVAIPDNFGPTILANKIFDSSLKFFGQLIAPNPSS